MWWELLINDSILVEIFNFSPSYKELQVEHATQKLRQQMQGLASHQTLPTANTFEYPFNFKFQSTGNMHTHTHTHAHAHMHIPTYIYNDGNESFLDNFVCKISR